MKIFDVEYYFYRFLRQLRFNLKRRRRRLGYLIPPVILKRLLYLVILVALSLALVGFVGLGGGGKGEKRVDVVKTGGKEGKSDLISPSPRVQLKSGSSPTPEVSARSILIIDQETGQELLNKNAGEKMPPASLTKLVTALLALDNYNLSEKVIVLESCTQVDGNNLGLVAGEIWSVEELLYAMLVMSASDATCVLSSHVAQVTDYVAAMNLKAQSMGMANTSFVNPIGLDDPKQRSNAYDLVLLGQKAMNDETIRRIVATPRIEIQGRKLVNTNEILGKIDGVVGIKTGTTEEAKECLLFAVRRDGRDIIGVILGSDDRFGEGEALINWVYKNYSWDEVTQ